MSAIAGLILWVVLVFATTLWPMKKSAEWFGAERATYGAVIAAVIVLMVISVLGAFAAGAAGQPLIVLAVLPVAIFVLSRMLGTTFLRALGIQLVAGLVGVVVSVALYAVLGSIVSLGSLRQVASGHSDEAIVAELADAVDALCRCDIDEACYEVRMERIGRVEEQLRQTALTPEDQLRVASQSMRAMQCLMKVDPEGAPAVQAAIANAPAREATAPAAAEVPQPAAAQPEPAPAPQEPAPAPLVKKPLRYAWRPASVEELPVLVSKVIRYETARGVPRHGLVTEVVDGVARIERGGMSYAASAGDMRRLEVYDVTSD